MRGLQTLGDALMAAGGEGLRRLRDAPTPMQFHSEIAAEMLERRQRALGISDEMIGQIIMKGLKRVRDASAYCETPIEKRVLPYLIFGDYGDDLLSIPANWHPPGTDDELPTDDVVVIPQFRFMRFRLDFALLGFRNGTMHVVCVECDGRDTHDEDADRRRDKCLASFGIPTIRISGADCYATPYGSSVRAVNALRELMEG